MKLRNETVKFAMTLGLASVFAILAMSAPIPVFAQVAGDDANPFGNTSNQQLTTADELQSRAETLLRAYERVRAVGQQPLMLRATLKLIDPLVKEDRIGVAAELLVEANWVVVNGEFAAELEADVNAKIKEFSPRKHQWDAAQAAKNKLKTEPANPDANKTIGKYNALVLRDWKTALPQLAKSSDAAMKSAAAIDIANPADAAHQVSLANSWWNMGKNYEGRLEDSLRLRAAFWYERAKAKASADEKKLIDERLKQIACILPKVSMPVVPDSPPRNVEGGKLGLVGRTRMGSREMDVLLHYQSSGILHFFEIMRLYSAKRISVSPSTLEVKFRGFVSLDKADKISVRLLGGSTSKTPGSATLTIDGKIVTKVGDDNPNDATVAVDLAKGTHEVVFELRGIARDCLFEARESSGQLLPLLHDDRLLNEAKSGTKTELVLGRRSDPGDLQRAMKWAWQSGGIPRGMYLTAQGRRSLTLDGPDKVPKEYFEIEAITFLGSSASKVDDQGLANLKGLQNLIMLGMRGSDITDEGLKTLSEIKSLRMLYLDRTSRITDDGIVHLAKLPMLENLDLESTNISSKGIQSLKECKKLRRLNLGGTKFSEADADVILGLPELRYLLLDNVQALTDATLEKLSKVPGLYELRLSRTNITDQGLVSLAKNSRLGYLNLAGTKVTDEGLKSLKPLTGLSRVDLSSMRGVTNAGLEHLSHVPGLTSVILFSVPGITDEGLAHVAKLSKLQSLTLDNNRQITDAGLTNLQGLSSLTSINLNNTGVTADGVTAFKLNHPNCRVSFQGKQQ